MKKVGKEVLFIGTDDNNPRNGEGSFIKLNNGSILFGYTEFSGCDSCDDDAQARICTVISSDNGETWHEKKVMFIKPENAKNIMCLSFLRMDNGDIGAFYIIKNGDSTDRIVLTRSADEGKSWSEPINCLSCIEIPDYYVINNDRVFKMKNGRIILPLARHTVLQAPNAFMPGDICFVYSDDDGKSWVKTEAELLNPFKNNPDGYEEPGLYELEDGSLWCYIRTNTGFQYECFSTDGGITWTNPEPNLFFSSPCSPMVVKDCGELTVAVFNPIPEHILRNDKENDLWGRTPYIMAVSKDRGKTFSRDNLFYIEDDLNNGYCYPAVFDGGDYMLLAYYHSNNSGVCLNSTKMIKIMYDEIS